MDALAGHHGKAAGAEHGFLHALHPCGDVALHNDELLFGSVVVPPNHAARRSFHDRRRRPGLEVAIFNEELQAIVVIALRELDV
jgi:hypothetical protein